MSDDEYKRDLRLRAELHADAVLGALGRNVRAARLERNIRRADLGRQAGLTRRELSKIERGKADVSLAILVLLARILGVDPLSLLP